MNVFAEIEGLVLEAVRALVAEGRLPSGLDLTAVTVELPRDPAHGELASNAAMVLAKPARLSPREIAMALAEKLTSEPMISAADVAGPGFLNLRLEPAYWQKALRAGTAKGAAFGRSNMGEGARVIVEYVSANPTGPMHVGHARGAVFGDALANLLAQAGYDVTREYYINDGGAQVDVLARSAYLRYLEAGGRAVEFPDGTYPGDYLKPVGEALRAEHGAAFEDQPEQVWLPKVRAFAIEAMMDMIRDDLKALGVTMDRYSSEAAIRASNGIGAAMDALAEKGLLYRGTLEPPKGKMPEDWEAREQLLFRSTDYGDDIDRPVQKSDGDWTYFAPDIAYHADKAARADQLINVFGADHSGYVKRMKAAVAALTDNRVPLDIKLVQLVKLFKNGEPFKMSKRAGTFVTLRDLIDEVGAGVTRFHMLTRKNDAPLDFDFAKVQEHSRDNPVYYVQYAHARICSTEKRAREAGIAPEIAQAKADLSRLSAPEEIALMRKLLEWPRQVEQAARAHEPHRVAFYLYELAGALHGLWNRGHDEPRLRFIQPDAPEETLAKLCLLQGVKLAIANGLAILGVEPVTEMR